MHRRATLRHTTQFTSRFQTALPDRPPWSGSGMAVARYSTRCLSSSGVYSWRNLYVDVSYARTRLVSNKNNTRAGRAATHSPHGHLRPVLILPVLDAFVDESRHFCISRDQRVSCLEFGMAVLMHDHRVSLGRVVAQLASIFLCMPSISDTRTT